MEIAWRLPARLGLASSRRPLLVVLTIACALGIGHVLAGSDGSPEEQRLLLGVHTSLVAIVLAAAAIDLDHMILPNALTLGGAALALATAPLRAVGLGGAALGAAVGLALTVLPFLLYKRLRGRSGLGLGDAACKACSPWCFSAPSRTSSAPSFSAPSDVRIRSPSASSPSSTRCALARQTATPRRQRSSRTIR